MTVSARDPWCASLRELWREDPPWVVLQVFWKVLTFTASGVLVYLTVTIPPSTPVAVQALLYAFAGVWLLVGIFTVLGES